MVPKTMDVSGGDETPVGEYKYESHTYVWPTHAHEVVLPCNNHQEFDNTRILLGLHTIPRDVQSETMRLGVMTRIVYMLLESTGYILPGDSTCFALLHHNQTEANVHATMLPVGNPDVLKRMNTELSTNDSTLTNFLDVMKAKSNKGELGIRITVFFNDVADFDTPEKVAVMHEFEATPPPRLFDLHHTTNQEGGV